MSFVGGSIVEVNIRGRAFKVAADADGQRNLGGSMNEVQPNGDRSTSRLIKTIALPAITGLNYAIDDDRGDQEFLQETANLNDFWRGSVTYASGATYQGRLQITGDILFNNQSATATFDLTGTGTLTRQ